MAEEVLSTFKIATEDDFQIEYEILPVFDTNEIDTRKNEINKNIADIDAISAELNAKIDFLNKDIDRLTNHADGLDYMVAVGIGVLCGLIDSFVVGVFDVEHFKENKKKVTKKFENIVINKGEKARKNDQIKNAIDRARKKAAEKGEKLSKEKEEEIKKRITASLEKKLQFRKSYDEENQTKKALKSALEVLQKKFQIPSDNLWNGAGINVSAETHHLDDIAHHPTVIGLIAAIVSQIFHAGIFFNKAGECSIQFGNFMNKDGELDKEELKKWLLQILLPIGLSGLLTWLLYILKSKKKKEIDEKVPKPIQKLILFLVEVPAIIVVLEIINNWLGHLISDMAGSSSSAGKSSAENEKIGMGIPGLFMSLFKYLASIHPFNLTPLPGIVDRIYKDERFDLRSELAALDQLGKQAIPVIAGDLLVRSFYFIRRLALEYKEHGDWKLVNWKNVIPFRNRTIVRMMTIESGTFTAIDIADAAIRSAIKNGGQVQSPTFCKDFILSVNFVGIGRFAIAVGTDVGMGMKRQKLIKERMQYRSEDNLLLTAKLFYMQEGMWIEAVDTEKAIQELTETTERTMLYFIESCDDISESIENIGNNAIEAEKKNPGLINEMKDILSWG